MTNNTNSHQHSSSTDHTTLLFRIGFFVTIISLASNFIYLGTLTHGKTSEYDVQDHPSDMPETNLRRSSPAATNDKTTTTIDLRSEEQVLRKIFQRSISNLEFCHRLGQSKAPANTKQHPNGNDNNNRNSPSDEHHLPEFGIINTLSTYFAKYDDTTPSSSSQTTPSCRKPPPTDCRSTGWTLVTTSDDSRDAKNLLSFLNRHASYHRTMEIILLWTSSRETLPDDVSSFGTTIGEDDTSFRIVVVSEMTTSDDDAAATTARLYRYHPSLRPLSSSLLYLDHDDHFQINLPSLETGWNLWKRNADIPIGSRLFGLTFHSDEDGRRIQTQLTRERRHRSKLLTNGHTETTDDNRAQFVPSCQSTTGHVSFDTTSPRHHFDFGGYGVSAQGLFLHDDLACFVWHEAFREVRRTLLERRRSDDDDDDDERRMMEDVVVSVLLTQVAGKGARGYVSVREEEDETTMRGEEEDETTVARRLSRDGNATSGGGGMTTSLSIRSSSLVEYFGSLHPGSVGWCLGSETRYVVDDEEEESCDNDDVKVTDVPWMVAGGLGYDQC